MKLLELKPLICATCAIILFLACSCGAHYHSRNPFQRAYQFTYCNRMSTDGKHCEVWATPCGKLDCGKETQ